MLPNSPAAEPGGCRQLRVTADGTARIRLPECEELGLTHGQPVAVRCTVQGIAWEFLCTATSDTHQAGVPVPVAAAALLDPSVQCKPPVSPASCQPVAAQLQAQQPAPGLAAFLKHAQAGVQVYQVEPIRKKVVNATHAQVRLPEGFAGSGCVAAKLQQRLVQQGCVVHLASTISCCIESLLPAGPQGTVYRLVPSTQIQVLSSDSAQPAPEEAAEAGTAEAAARRAAAAGPHSSQRQRRSGGGAAQQPRASGSSASSRCRSKEGSGAEQSEPGTSSSHSRRQERGRSSGGGGGDRKGGSASGAAAAAVPKGARPKASSRSQGEPIAASASLFDLLGEGGED